MAHFRGIIQGNRGQASRLGHKSTGLDANLASWQGAVDVSLSHVDGVDMVTVRLVKHQGAGTERLLYHGPVSGKSSDAPALTA